MISKIRAFLNRFDIYQLMSVPIVVVILFFSINFKSTTIKIGTVLPLTGPDSLRAINHRNGLLLAVNHINGLGGINGRKIQLELRDNSGSAEKTAEIVRDLIYENEVIALTGGINPEETRVMQFFADKAQVPLLTSLCTHFEISAGGSDFVFRSITDDQRQFDAIAEFATRRFNSRKPALIFDNDFYGTESAQRFIETSSRFGQQVCLAISYKSGTLNFKKQIELILSSNPDSLVILAPPAESAMILRHAREARFARPVLGGNAMSATEFISLAGVYSEGTIVTLPFNARLGGQRAEYFLAEYFEKHSAQADADAAMGYEAMMIMALALRASDSDPLTLRNALASLHGYESVAGSGGFDANGNQVRPAEIAIIKERQKIPSGLEELF